MGKTTTEYYNEFAEQQYASGIHYRHLAIMGWLKRFGMPKNGNILEIGCGVGTQTELILRYLDLNSSVTAVDISDKSIAYAQQRLARYSNVKLLIGDIIELEVNAVFDSIVLPDVLEHIPLDQHNRLFEKLSSIISSDGFILIHIPHPHYLEWLRINKPETLQIIDNPIQTDQLLNLVYRHGLYLHHLESYSIYANPHDYQVVVIKKKVQTKEYNVVSKPKIESIYNRLQRKLKYLARGKK